MYLVKNDINWRKVFERYSEINNIIKKHLKEKIVNHQLVNNNKTIM